MSLLKTLSAYMETYRGHDQSLALIGYGCTMISGLLREKSQLRVKILILSSQISSCRTLLRFLDDFSMLDYTLEYGLGRNVNKIKA